MKQIYTLTLNPAVDKSSSIDRVIPEHKLRCEKPKYEPGGGGINVSRAIRKLGGNSVAVYPQGGPSGQMMKNLLTQEDIEQIPVDAVNWTRENFIVVERQTNKQYRFGMPGLDLKENEWKKCMEIVSDPSRKIDYLVASGSMPDGVPVDYYARLARSANKNNTRFVLDTSGDALNAAMEEGFYLLKPNINELSQLVGRKLEDVHEQEEAAMEVVNKGKIEVLIVSLGGAGAMLASREGIIHVSAPSAKKKSTVGAGDSMVAGIVLTLSRGKSLVEAIRYGVASGTAATMNSGTELCKLEDVENLYRWIVTNAQR
jgi:6-phosphofructokinase 2